MFGDRPEDEMAMRTSPGARLRLKLVGEDLLVRQVIGDRGEQLDVGAEAHDARGQVGRRPDALHVVALQVVRDRSRAAVAAREHPCTARVGVEQDRRRAVERGGLDRARRPGRVSLAYASKYDAALTYGAAGNCSDVPGWPVARRPEDRGRNSYGDALQDERGRGREARE